MPSRSAIGPAWVRHWLLRNELYEQNMRFVWPDVNAIFVNEKPAPFFSFKKDNVYDSVQQGEVSFHVTPIFFA